MKNQMINLWGVIVLACGLPSFVFSQVVDPALVSAINNQTSAINSQGNRTNLTLEAIQTLVLEQLSQTNSLLEKADEELRRLGDLAETDDVVGIQEMQRSLVSPTNNPLVPSEDFEYRDRKPDTATVLNSDFNGLREAVTENYTDAEGREVKRDDSLYYDDAAMMERIQQYKNARDAALLRRDQLREALAEGVEVINGVTDAATLAKQQAVLDLLQAEIAASDRAVEIAAADLEVFEKERANHDRVKGIAAQEEFDARRKAESERRLEEAASAQGGGTGGNAAPPMQRGSIKLPWPPQRRSSN